MTDLAMGGQTEAAHAVDRGLSRKIRIANAVRMFFAAAPTGLRPGGRAGETA